MVFIVLTGGKFFAALHSEGSINEETVSASELDKVYAPLREQVSNSLHRQEMILAQIQVSGHLNLLYKCEEREESIETKVSGQCNSQPLFLFSFYHLVISLSWHVLLTSGKQH